jgi:ribosomal-protein-alanine N-acetyltransferase
MTACPTLLTERLILRPLEESDLDDYTELVTTPEVRQALRLPESFSRGQAWLGMAQWRGQWELRGTGQFALEERATGRFVGRAGLHRPEQDDWPGGPCTPTAGAGAMPPRPARLRWPTPSG